MSTKTQTPKNKKAKKNAKPRVQRPIAQNTKVVAPVAAGFVRKMREPRFARSARNGDVTVDHEEFIAEVAGSVAFSNTTYSVNPGLLSSFPWLAQMAPLYESYRFERLEYQFQSEAPTSASGSLMMALDYDASDPAPGSKVQLAAYRGYVRSPPWQACTNSSIKEDLNKQKSYFVRSGTLAANQDIKLYDVGFLNVATQGQANTAIIGELYVRYRVRFMTPQIQDDGLGLARSAKIVGTTAASAPTMTGNAPLTLSGTSAAMVLTANTAYQCFVNMFVVGTTLGPAITTGSTATIQTPNAVVSTGNNNYMYAAEVSFLPGQVLNLGVTNATTTSVNVSIGQYNVAL
jgi:hypothetical protein